MPGCNLRVYLSICMLRILAACDMLKLTGKETAGADMKLLKRAAAALVLLGVLLGAGCGENNRERPAEAHGTRRLTYWSDLNRFTADITNLGQLPAYQELQKRLNVEIEFIHPKAGQFQDGLELILASRNIPILSSFPSLNIPAGR